MQSGDPRERRRCPAWRFGAVFTEWCRSLEALPSRMWDGGRDHHPAGCEVSREALQQESSPRIVVGRKPLTEESSCEAGHITCTRPQAERQIPPHDPKRASNGLGYQPLSRSHTGWFRPLPRFIESRLAYEGCSSPTVFGPLVWPLGSIGRRRYFDLAQICRSFKLLGLRHADIIVFSFCRSVRVDCRCGR